MKTRAPEDLSPELRALVRESVALLGEVIRRELGDAAYGRIETLRSHMAALRGRSLSSQRATLRAEKLKLEALTPRGRLDVAHAFTLMLELMNACENAYRTYRLQGRTPETFKRRPKAIIYVLTAHPTEARSPENIALFHEIQATLTRALARGFAGERESLRHLLEITWRLGVTRHRKPRVVDEADHIYSILLRDETLNTLLDLSRDLAPIYVRTWVGGDKDGNPFVNEITLRNSLALSRRRLVAYADRALKAVHASLVLVGSPTETTLAWRRATAALRALRVLRAGDGARTAALRARLKALSVSYELAIGAPHPALARLRRLGRMFPALVVPLELRESSDLLNEAARGKPAAITRMLRELARLSAGGEVIWYARGLIISMTGSVDDLESASTLMKRTLGGLKLPIIPLFEQHQALRDSSAITEGFLRKPTNRKAVRELWDNKYEIMLGYSDSAKETGVLSSRLAIAQAMTRLEKTLRRFRVTPIYFHGSGGSVDRGGGSVDEQTSWWPKSALEHYKATVQGEMVERSFASPEIARRQFERLTAQVNNFRATRSLPAGTTRALNNFADRAAAEYQRMTASPEFLEVILQATPYPYLKALKIGSRPTKRAARTTSLASLRAIPWVMCWTQTRVMFPTWWGLGHAWKMASAKEKAVLKQAFKTSPLFSSFTKVLGFTLAKVELGIWRMYLDQGRIDPGTADAIMRNFEREHALCLEFVRAVTGQRKLLWFRPWLATSIELRSPMIHPLNLLQIIDFAEKNPALMRETVTGIASGMMTTG